MMEMLILCSALALAGPGVVKSEFVFEKAPFPQCHASTLVETPTGLVAAWFGGKHEKNPDVGIWLARKVDGKWTAPVEVVNGVQSPQKRHPCWNPVLYQPPDAPLLLFYKVGPSPRAWWGMLTTSADGGKTWAEPHRLQKDILGPIKDKPVALPNGDLLCGSSTEHDGWRVHFEITPDLGKTWTRVGPVNDGREFGAIQPTILLHAGGRLQALCRSRQNRIVEIWSEDGGKSWSPMKATPLPNPSAGIDAVTLKDGRHLLVYNHTTRRSKPRGREMLNVAVTTDGKSWKAALVLEKDKGEYSYPAVIQTSDGLVHTSYTWKRQRVKHVVIDPSKLELTEIRDGNWPE